MSGKTLAGRKALVTGGARADYWGDFNGHRLETDLASGAVTTAAVALRLGNVDITKGPVVAVVSGGNVAPEAFAKYVTNG